MTVPPRRSAIPKVVGILMIIFGSLGLLSALSNLGGSSFDAFRAAGHGPMDDYIDALERAERVLRIVGLIGLPISALHIGAGIRCAQYKASAPRLALLYAASAAIHTTVASIISYAMLVPAFNELTAHTRPGGAAGNSLVPLMIVGVIVGVAWPVLVGVLMSRPAARAACTW